MSNTEKKIYTVVEINNVISQTISIILDNSVEIIGEISNFKISGGNLYATLKDEESSISVVMWKVKSLNIQNGDKVKISGRIKGYPRGGSYNLVASAIDKQGIGELHQIYEQTKDKYNTLGYYDNKNPLPNKIINVGIVTSVDGAALQDILYVLKKNNFGGNVWIRNCIAQGDNCPLSVASGIQYFIDRQYELPLDVLLIARGGGSFEDLMGFSDPLVLESLYLLKQSYQNNICSISAIGHEIDFMLSDYVADIRSPTPSIAGEILSTYWISINKQINDYSNEAVQIKSNIESRINFLADELLNIKENIKSKLTSSINDFKHKMEKINIQAENLDMQLALEKGFCLMVNDEGDIINSIGQIKIGQKLNIKLIDGEVNVIVKKLNES